MFKLSSRLSAVRLDDVRAAATKLYVFIACLHVPAAAFVALNARNAWIGPTLVMAAVAVAVIVSARFLKPGPALYSIVAVGLTIAPIVFVFAGRGDTSGFSGHGDWQIDYHMYFFAVFAMLVGYVDWRPIVVSAALTAGHHLILDVLFPTAVFPEEGLDRVALHAITVVAECSMLIWIANTVQALFKRIDDLVDFTTQATAEAIALEQAENVRLRQELAVVRTS